MTEIYTKCAWCGDMYRAPGSKEWVRLLPGAEQSWERRGYKCSHGMCPECGRRMLLEAQASREQGGEEEVEER